MIDAQSSTWQAVKELCEREMAIAQSRNERPGVTEREADDCRGALRAFRQVLALAEPPRKAPAAAQPRTDGTY